MTTRVAVTTGAPGTVAAFAPTLPTHAAGDRLLLVVTGKYDTTTPPTINQGWTQVRNYTGGTGVTGNDTGPAFIVAYAKDATSSAETAPTVTPGATAPNSWEWTCVSHRPGSGKEWKDPIGVLADWTSGASDTNTASPLTGAPTIKNGVTGGDALFAVGTIPTDLGSALGAVTFTVSGLSGGTQTTATTQYVENALGNDTAAAWIAWEGFTGTTASATTSISMAITGASNLSGAIMLFAFREQTMVKPSVLTVYNRGSVQDAGASSSAGKVMSWTPWDNSKIYVVAFGNGSGGRPNPTISDNQAGAITWNLEMTEDPGSDASFRVWSADIGSSPPSNLQVTVTPSVASWFTVAAFEVINGQVKSGQKVENSAASGATLSTGSMPSAATSGNTSVFIGAHNADLHTPPPVPTGFSALIQQNSGSAVEQITIATSTTFTASNTSVTLATDTGNVWAGGLMEFETPSSAAPPETGTFEGWGLDI